MKKKVLSSKEGYNLYANYYKKDYPLLDSFDWNITEKILAQYIQPHYTILDLGCGDGRVMKRLKDSNIIGVDISESMIKIAKKKNPQSTFYISDALSLPFHANAFDLIFSFFLLVHIDNLTLFFQEVYRILKDESIFICNNIPQRRPPLLSTNQEKFIIKSFDYSDKFVLSTAEKYGFFLIQKEEVFEKNTKISTIFVLQKI